VTPNRVKSDSEGPGYIPWPSLCLLGRSYANWARINQLVRAITLKCPANVAPWPIRCPSSSMT
jgi:hypothetical protein